MGQNALWEGYCARLLRPWWSRLTTSRSLVDSLIPIPLTTATTTRRPGHSVPPKMMVGRTNSTKRTNCHKLLRLQAPSDPIWNGLQVTDQTNCSSFNVLLFPWAALSSGYSWIKFSKKKKKLILFGFFFSELEQKIHSFAANRAGRHRPLNHGRSSGHTRIGFICLKIPPGRSEELADEELDQWLDKRILLFFTRIRIIKLAWRNTVISQSRAREPFSSNRSKSCSIQNGQKKKKRMKIRN